MCDGDPGNDYTGVRGRKHEPYSHRPKIAGQAKIKDKSMLIISFLHEGCFSQRVLSGKPNNQFRILL
jgi:hypothetical protein